MLVLFWVWSVALPHCPFALSTHLFPPPYLPPPVLSVATIYGSDLCMQASWDSFLKHLCPWGWPLLHVSQAAQVSSRGDRWDQRWLLSRCWPAVQPLS